MFRRDPMLWRFSLYGFPKSQQCCEPFFLLVLRGKGMTFRQPVTICRYVSSKV